MYHRTDLSCSIRDLALRPAVVTHASQFANPVLRPSGSGVSSSPRTQRSALMSPPPPSTPPELPPCQFCHHLDVNQTAAEASKRAADRRHDMPAVLASVAGSPQEMEHDFLQIDVLVFVEGSRGDRNVGWWFLLCSSCSGGLVVCGLVCLHPGGL